MNKSLQTRRRRLAKARRICRAICEANDLAGCVMDEKGKGPCGPKNCDVYRAMVRGEIAGATVQQTSQRTEGKP